MHIVAREDVVVAGDVEAVVVLADELVGGRH